MPFSEGIPGHQLFLLLPPKSSQGGTVDRQPPLLPLPGWESRCCCFWAGPLYPYPVLTLSTHGLKFTRKCRRVCALFPGLCVNLKVRTEESPAFPHPESNQLKFLCYDAISLACKSQRTKPQPPAPHLHFFSFFLFFFHSAKSCSGECSQTALTRPDRLIQESSTFWPSR